jgi:two-component system, chemotaxis family, protein-glutamate methylesterase/glutaminase
MKPRDIVVIGGSRGAFSVLRALAEQLPEEVPASICVVLHIGRHDSVLPDLMSRWGKLPARHPVDGETLQPGTIYVAPPGRHMVIDGAYLRLTEGPAENFARPAIDPLFRSAAPHADRVVGVLLSGDLDDGAAGIAAVDAHGGYTIVQDPGESEAPSMPRAAIASATIDSIVTSRGLASGILDAIGGATRMNPESPKKSDELDVEANLGGSSITNPEILDRIGDRSTLTCPECGGVLWRLHDDYPLRYRCHTGHAFSAISLDEGHSKSLENSIWAAVRAVNERIAFAHERRNWAERTSNQDEAAHEKARIDEGEQLAALLRSALGARGVGGNGH